MDDGEHAEGRRAGGRETSSQVSRKAFEKRRERGTTHAQMFQIPASDPVKKVVTAMMANILERSVREGKVSSKSGSRLVSILFLFSFNRKFLLQLQTHPVGIVLMSSIEYVGDPSAFKTDLSQRVI